MPTPDAPTFCKRFLENLAKGAWPTFKSFPAWTGFATEAAAEVCRTFGLQVSREYLRLDVAGWERSGENQRDDWYLRVAFEHEQAPHKWHDEFCKLTHILADLRVLSFYHRFDRDPPIEQSIEERAHLLRDRINRVSDCQWLFVVGPYSSTCDQPFLAFTLNDSRVVPLDGLPAVCPRNLVDFDGAI